jgi:hypothetical protein
MQTGKKTLLVSYIYPSATAYVNDFIESVSAQQTQNFHVWIFHDGIDNPAPLFRSLNHDVRFFQMQGTPTKIRYDSLAILAGSDYTHIIFQDVDDTMSANRVEVATRYLSDFDLVVNDLSLMNEHGTIIKEKIWSARLPNRFEFDYSFILHKNIVGFGNTAVRSSLLGEALQFDNVPVAADWFLFFQLMIKTRARAVFTSDCCTNYRQHAHNIAGLKKTDTQRLRHVLEVKKAHYQGLCNIGLDFHKELQKISNLAIPEKLPDNTPVHDYFWWEEIEV